MVRELLSPNGSLAVSVNSEQARQGLVRDEAEEAGLAHLTLLVRPPTSSPGSSQG